MSNSLDSGTRTVSAHKAGKSVSVLDEDMLPQKNIWHFFSGDRLAYLVITCLLYTSPSPRDLAVSRMPSSA